MVSALTIGSAVFDIITIAADTDIEKVTLKNATSSFLMLEQGRKIEALSITQHVGGGAVNAAVAMARLGHQVSALVKMGQDPAGEAILERLTQEGIGTDAVFRTGALPTGTAVMVSSHDKNATIFTQRGANTLLVDDDLDPEHFSGRDVVYITNLSNQSADCFPIAVERARKAGAFVASNPGIRQLTSRPDELMRSLPSIDLLAINKIEAASLIPAVRGSGDLSTEVPFVQRDAMPALAQDGLGSPGYKMPLAAFCRMIRSHGVSNILITDGPEGAYLGTREGLFHCSAIKVEVKGTVGAGDAYNSTLAVFLASGRSVDDSMKAAAMNAASVISDIDTQTGLLDTQSLERELSSRSSEAGVTKLFDWT